MPELSRSFHYWQPAPRWRLFPWLANLGNPAMSPQVQGRKQAPSTPFSKAVEIGKEVGGNHYKLSPHECEIPRKDGCIGGGAGGGGQRHFLGEAPLFWIYLTLLVTMVIRAHIFCPQTTQELPKKHHDARMPEQLTTNALSQINYRHTRHYEDCKEVCLCQQTMQTAFWKICVRVCA